MQRSLLYLSVAVLFLTTILPAVIGIKCYSCNTNLAGTVPGGGPIGVGSNQCADSNQISQLYTDCSSQIIQPGQQQPDQNRCYKTTTALNGQISSVQRGCGSPQQLGGALSFTSRDGCVLYNNMHICSCDTNYCNGSKRLHTTSVFSCAAALVFFLLYGSR